MKFNLLFLSLLSFVFVSAQLSGTYTIHKAQLTKKKNYNSFTEAISAIKAKGVSANVVFYVKPDTYHEFLNFEVINFNSQFTISFVAADEGKVRISNDAMAMLIFNSLNILFENFEFDSRTSSYSSVLLFDNVSGIKFNKCTLTVLTTNEKDLPLVSMKNSNSCSFENSRIIGSNLFMNLNVNNCSYVNCSFQYTSKLSFGNFAEEVGILNCRANGVTLENTLEEEFSSVDVKNILGEVLPE